MANKTTPTKKKKTTTKNGTFQPTLVSLGVSIIAVTTLIVIIMVIVLQYRNGYY